ncbi:MAG: Integrin alpha beta-propellor repeat protein [Nitrospira sp.]|nr:MAG: Integrin alpha beta-propellor repeat protein [Nitrospira sp.]
MIIGRICLSSKKSSRGPWFCRLLAVGLLLSISACSGAELETSQQVVAQLVQQGYLKASNAGTGDRFGYRVAVSGDTVVVSALLEQSASTGINGSQVASTAPASGAVYVFVKTQTGWAQQAYLKASNAQSNDWFGYSLALSGNTLAVGAVLEDSAAIGANGSQDNNGATDSGAVYVFERVGNVWMQQAYLKASNTTSGHGFGSAVSLSNETLAVGAFMGDAVYVFLRSGGSWSQEALLRGANTETGDWFGSAVSIDNDTLVVGAPLEASAAVGINGNYADNTASQSGAAYVFSRAGGIWTQQAYVKASNTDANDGFGFSVALSGDTLVVGAVGESSSAKGINGNQIDNTVPHSGAAYVFIRARGAWVQQAYVKASNTDGPDVFGSAVALNGDRLVVGAWAEESPTTGINGNQTDNSAVNSGAAYVFKRNSGVWSQEAYVKASNTGVDMFGTSVALSESWVVIGAPLEASGATVVDGNQLDNSAPQSGAAYAFHF